MKKTIIKLDNLSMCFNLNNEKVYSLKEYLIKGQCIKKQHIMAKCSNHNKDMKNLM